MENCTIPIVNIQCKLKIYDANEKLKNPNENYTIKKKIYKIQMDKIKFCNV